ncbi:hypothetical protein RHS03_08662, partial [Rhizoctonia solani]
MTGMAVRCVGVLLGALFCHVFRSLFHSDAHYHSERTAGEHGGADQQDRHPKPVLALLACPWTTAPDRGNCLVFHALELGTGTTTLGTAAGRQGAKGAQGQHRAGTPVDRSSAPVVGSLSPWCSPPYPLQCPAWSGTISKHTDNDVAQSFVPSHH